MQPIQTHPFAPICDARSEILILGSFPSVQSRARNFYYAHPQNRFWRMLAGVYATKTPVTMEEKCDILLKNHLALWDVLQECAITGSADASIQNAKPNDLTPLLQNCALRRILCNGGKAYELFRRHIVTEIPVYRMPSTSPANAARRLEQLIEAWREGLLQ
ncbi:MAG: DNA-deoxyinosine glycosylase [Clostridiales bacterium]|nr:DNA-deoxyinosine glycosylase [Clostridiales bacterium]